MLKKKTTRKTPNSQKVKKKYEICEWIYKKINDIGGLDALTTCGKSIISCDKLFEKKNIKICPYCNGKIKRLKFN